MDGIIYLVIALCIYFIPVAVAHSRNHRSFNAIFIVNLLLGWSVIGWIWALIWANTGNTAQKTVTGEPTYETHVKCPDCAEIIKKEAKVCKHCGCKLVPQ